MLFDLCALRISGPEMARRELCYRMEQCRIPTFATPSGTGILAAYADTLTAIVGEINDDLQAASPQNGQWDGRGLRVTLRPNRGILPGTDRSLLPAPIIHGACVRE